MKLIRVNSWNIGLAFAGMMLTFLFNIGNNILMTSVIRSLYSFPCFLVIVYIVRLLLSVMLQGGTSNTQENDIKGRHVDIVTPEDENLLSDVQAAQQTDDKTEDEFTPLHPPKVVPSQEVNPDLVVKAVRHLNQE